MELKDITLKGLKYFDGPDSLCFTAQVYVRGKLAFVAMDSGEGGEHELMAYPDMLPVLRECEAFARTLPPVDLLEGMTKPCTLNDVIDELIYDVMEQKWLKKNCKTKTVYRTPALEKREWYTLDWPPTPSVKAAVLRLHPDAIFGEDVIK
jgi:hypothetical protein